VGRRGGARYSEIMATRKRGGSTVPDEHLEVLRAIWTEMKGLNARVDKTNDRLEAVRQELKDDQDALRRRVVESEVRLATVVTQLSSDVHERNGLIREWRSEHRADRADLRSRIDRIEEHVGIGRPR
jgi:hypothetical protein